MTLLPDPKEYPENRLFCLDILRGLDMFYLAVGATILRPLCLALGCKEAADFLASHPWEGFTVYDLIMPLFIFMSGAAVPLAMKRRLGPNGELTAAFHRHVWGRFALLWVLGLVAQGRLQTFDPMLISPYNNTLQTIAVGYIVAAYVLTLKSWAVKIAIPVALSVIYGCWLHFGGDYTLDGNATMPVERWVLSFLVPAGSKNLELLQPGGTYGYTWFLPSLMFPVLALAGAFSTIILSSKHLSETKRAAYVLEFGVGSLLLGLVLEKAGVHCVKHIFAVSFTFQAIGWSVILLGLLFILCDVLKVRRGSGLILLFGQFALAAYMCEAVFREACYKVADRLVGGLVRFVPEVYGDAFRAFLFGLVVIAFVAIWRGFKTARKRS